MSYVIDSDNPGYSWILYYKVRHYWNKSKEIWKLPTFVYLKLRGYLRDYCNPYRNKVEHDTKAMILHRKTLRWLIDIHAHGLFVNVPLTWLLGWSLSYQSLISYGTLIWLASSLTVRTWDKYVVGKRDINRSLPRPK